ncbi:flagellar hook-basal body complex protein FliE [Priestia taiwanensis]|uniref:Flagellar hook-basal body complex protein FliE n=1 Tax=Priestia taiwanensis TaxID=1347902 RepID=A0A917APG5_9BACI|nr:flagellar hook-basal body complex protein FliE [Priestia taiwanensis]MBM7362845.1 flagellar hook-basal body complex protein FliE [Priestia taiwanensis]GGE65589.1 flagellar hook-basal body complex protein FliE [Priestia taiwanensis]
MPNYINGITGIQSVTTPVGDVRVEQKNTTSFSTVLKDAINQVNEAQLASDKATNLLIKGGDIELHDVMIAAEKSSVMLQTTIEVRNKVVEAYQEVMRMSM